MVKDKKKVVEGLSKVLSRVEAEVLVFLKEHGSSYARDIEHGAGLRQPEVCIATKKLLSEGFIRMEKVEHEGKGRPRHLYSLNSNVKARFLKMVDKQVVEFEKTKESVNELF